MKRTRIKPISTKQGLELAKCRLLRWQLFLSQNGKCIKCGRVLYWNQTELSHKKSLARGGQTTRENTEVTCANWLSGCHPEEHGLHNVYGEQPAWSK